MTWVAIFVALLGVAVVVLTAYQVFQTGAPPDYARLDATARGALERRVRADTTGTPSIPGTAGTIEQSDADDLPLLRTAAGIMVSQRYLSGLWLGCFLIQFASTLGSLNLVHLVITGLFAVPVAGLTRFVERRAAAGAAFLSQHPAAGPVEPVQ